MTYEEALKILKRTRKDEKTIRVMGEFYDILTDALEKRMKKRVTKDRCPSCDVDVVGSGFYCWNCGQRLDWSNYRWE